MASLVKSKSKRGTHWRIDFYISGNSKRKCVRLGKMTERQAESVKTKVELLIAAKVSGTAPDLDVIEWAAKRNDDFHAKLAQHGLVAPRIKAEITTVREFLDDYMAKRQTLLDAGKLKWRTVYNERVVKDALVEKFGDKPIDSINEGDALDFRNWLLTSGAKRRKKKTQEETTVQKKCAVAYRFFKDAVRRDLIRRNPFEPVPKANLATKNKAYISEANAKLVLEELPNTEWKLLFALSRWGGLRVGSEVRLLSWRDIDWERQRILVHSPKTERYEGRETRLIPMFPELVELLSDRYDEAFEANGYRSPKDDSPILPMLKDKTDAALIKTVERAIERAELKRWPRLWHNLRASRQTDLESVPGLSRHAVCEWLGNTESIARKHYLQVREDDYAKLTGEAGDLRPRKAQRKAQQHASQDTGTERQGSEQGRENPEESDSSPVSVGAEIPPRGFEPLSPP